MIADLDEGAIEGRTLSFLGLGDGVPDAELRIALGRGFGELSLGVRGQITGKRRVMRMDSMRKSPMEISTRIITSAAISAVRNPSYNFV